MSKTSSAHKTTEYVEIINGKLIKRTKNKLKRSNTGTATSKNEHNMTKIPLIQYNKQVKNLQEHYNDTYSHNHVCE